MWSLWRRNVTIEIAPLNHSSSLTIDLTATSVWSVLTAYGLVTNVLVIVGIMNIKKMVALTSYWLIISLAVCDLVMLSICVFHLIPATIFKSDYLWLSGGKNVVVMFVYDWFWYAGVLHLVVMSLNRYVSICHSRQCYELLYSRRRTVVAICTAYLAGAAISLPSLHPCCYVVWDYYRYLARYYNPDTSYAYVDMSVNSLTILLMFLFYLQIIVKVRKSRTLMQKHQREHEAANWAANHQHASGGPKDDGVSVKGQASSSSLLRADTRDENADEVDDNDDDDDDDEEPHYPDTTPTISVTQTAKAETSKLKDTQWCKLRHAVFNGSGSVRHANRGNNVTTKRPPKTSKTSAVSKREIRLLVQFAAVSMVFLISFITWQCVPLLGIEGSAEWIGFAVTALFFVNNSINPTVYLIFNQPLRARVSRLFSRKADNPADGRRRKKRQQLLKSQTSRTLKMALPAVRLLADTGLLLADCDRKQRMKRELVVVSNTVTTDYGSMSRTDVVSQYNSTSHTTTSVVLEPKRSTSIRLFDDRIEQLFIVMETDSVRL